MTGMHKWGPGKETLVCMRKNRASIENYLPTVYKRQGPNGGSVWRVIKRGNTNRQWIYPIIAHWIRVDLARLI